MEGIYIDGMPLSAYFSASLSPSKRFSQSNNYMGATHRMGGGESQEVSISIPSKDSAFIKSLFNYLRGGFDTIAPSEDDTFTVKGVSATSNVTNYVQSAGGLTGDGKFVIDVDIEWESPSIVSAIAPRYNGSAWEMHSYNGNERVNMVETPCEISVTDNVFTASAGTYSNIIFFDHIVPDSVLHLFHHAFNSGKFKKPNRYFTVSFNDEEFTATSKNVKMNIRNGLYELSFKMEKV